MLDRNALPAFLMPVKARRAADVRATRFSIVDEPGLESTAKTAPERDAEAGGGVLSKTLPGARMIGQSADNWCWSAVTQTVIDFAVGSAPSQDQLATRHLKLGGDIVCKAVGENRMNNADCGDGDSCRAHCNDFHRVRVVLAENGRFHSTIANNEAPGFAQLQAEIDAGRPVVCRVAWQLGGGHFIMVVGWTIGSDGIERVHVLDPKRNEGGEIIPERIISYQEFASNYTLMGARGAINFAYRIM